MVLTFNPLQPFDSIAQAWSHALNMPAHLFNASRLLMPIHSTTSEIGARRPDPTTRGDWQKHIFVPETPCADQLLSRLNYFLYRPQQALEHDSTDSTGHHGTKGLPLVVMLHGCDQDAPSFAQGTQMNVLADRDNAVVLYPEQSIMHNFQRCWRWYDPSESAGLADMRTLYHVIQMIINQYQLDRRRIYMAGMSAGAAMAALLAAHHPELFSAIALHSGPVLNKANSMSSGLSVMSDKYIDDDNKLIAYLADFKPHSNAIPTMILQGEHDHLVHPNHASALTKQFLYLNQVPPDKTPEITEYHQGTDQHYQHLRYQHKGQGVVEVIKASALEHAWGGGDASLPYHSSTGPDSSALIWQFFKQHVNKQAKRR